MKQHVCCQPVLTWPHGARGMGLAAMANFTPGCLWTDL
jgi:hypothetical protein